MVMQCCSERWWWRHDGGWLAAAEGDKLVGEKVEGKPRSKPITSIELCHSGGGELGARAHGGHGEPDWGKDDLRLGRRKEKGKEEGDGVF